MFCQAKIRSTLISAIEFSRLGARLLGAINVVMRDSICENWCPLPNSRLMSRLVLVSNRLPFALEPAGQGQWRVTPSPGGLVSALGPVLRGRGGTWIGW